MTRRGLGLALLLFGAAAHAGPSEGSGRVSLEGGWRLTPNDFFYASAAKAGFPRESSSPGGPLLAGSFGYMATEQIEVCIDLFAGGEQLRLESLPAFTSVTYGGMLGARLHLPLPRELDAWFGLLGGPTLVNVSGGNIEVTEELLTAIIGSAGVSYRVGDDVSLSLEYRLLLARGFVPGIGGVNGGGSWVGFGISFPLAGGPKPVPHS